MFVAGCCFDELPPAVIMEAVHSHRSTGGAVFFDPGPRSLTFRDPERKKALHALLDSTDVVLMTEVSVGTCSASRPAGNIGRFISADDDRLHVSRGLGVNWH